MKRMMSILLCALCLLCVGCSARDTLPTEIAEVGDALIKEDDVLLPSQTFPDDADVAVLQEQMRTVTSEMVCEWYSDMVTGGFAETSGEEGFTIHAAELTEGGRIEVLDYYGSYQSTTLSYPTPDSAATVMDAATDSLEQYLARQLADAERLELQQAIDSVLLGAEMVQLQSLSDYVRVSVFLEANEIRIQYS